MYYKRIIFIGFLLLLSGFCAFSQRYNFRQYDIEDGLTQSQVTGIAQDSKRRLWITTLGGLSSFNGRQFSSYTKTNGLNNNFALSVTINKQDEIWIGTSRGISRFDGENFKNYKEAKDWVGKLVTDKNGTVYGLSSSKLFKSDHGTTTFLSVTDEPKENVTALKTDKDGNIAVAVLRKGIFYLDGNTWKANPLNDQLKELLITDFFTDHFQKNKIWLLSTVGLLAIENGKISQYISGKFTTIVQDARSNIWIGSSNGAYYLTDGELIHFNGKNGFSDNMVNDIFKDAENNIWLATDGAGLYKFSDKNYVTFDESQGLRSKIVMSMAKGPTQGEIWMGTYGGLFQYKDGKIKEINIPSSKGDNQNINFLYNDSDKNIWIGTVYGGLWQYNGKKIVQMADDHNAIAYNTVLEDSRKRIWLSTNAGCFLLDKKTRQLQWISKQFGSTLLESGDGHILIGTQDGAYLIDNHKQVSQIKIKELMGSSILCMVRVADVIFFGTSDNGVVIWNKKTGKVRTLNTRDGLASDHIYSMLYDNKGLIWVGTGKGVNKIDPKDLKVRQNSPEQTLLVECNQNAILQDQNRIWIGTTKGAIVYTTTRDMPITSKPYIFINSVNAFSQNKGYQVKQQTNYEEKDLNKTITIPYQQNNIIINFTGIFLTNPEGLMYQFRLIGLDTKFSEPTSNTSINFTGLPPGKYTFEVKVSTRNGLSSLNTASFTFEITPPYYQTAIFRLFVFALIVLLIILAVYTIINLNERKRKLRLKIKLEEQFKVRKQTAEDFHDDLGNKLTRISVLSEVLSSMIDKDDTEKRNIILKIKDNVNELYQGTKDILWSLNPKNDKLSELMVHIREFGKEMFNETPVRFEDDIQLSHFDGKLSLDMSRNLLMIFKEAIHNALKHSKAEVVRFSAIINEGILEISVKDDGQGLNSELSMDGHGINNMNVRAQRINAKLHIISNHSGTEINLKVSLSTLMRVKNV